jgi:hypothetical protein
MGPALQKMDLLNNPAGIEHILQNAPPFAVFKRKLSGNFESGAAISKNFVFWRFGLFSNLEPSARCWFINSLLNKSRDFSG